MPSGPLKRGHEARSFFARRDGPQVWALDKEDGDSLFFLREGAAQDPRIWRATYAERFHCPLPSCPCPAFHTVRGGSKRDHFVHRYKPDVDHYGSDAWLAISKALLERWALARLEGARVSFDERLHTNHVADLVIRCRGRTWAALFISEQLGPVEALRRDADYLPRK